MRYKVTEVKPDPAGAVPRKLLAVEWMTYAFTGCSGAIAAANAAATVDWGELPDLGGVSLTAPVVHGIYQLLPAGWTGEAKESAYHTPPGYSIGEPAVAPGPAEARMLPYWRDPALPEGWTFSGARSGELSDPTYGYCALWSQAQGYDGVEICGLYPTKRVLTEESSWGDGRGVNETRTIAGRPARVEYSPAGPNYNGYVAVRVLVYDAATEALYVIRGLDGSLRGSNIEAVLAIARSLFEPPNPLPPPTAFRYDTYDNAGEVAEPGSYAFLADPADTTSAVTTYEALRDGTTTALLIHKSDAHGASQAALYDAVEAGDLFEWREADDCFVRYTVTEVKPDPAGAVPRKLLAVEWMTYAYTGCSGAISADAEVGMTWGNMLDLGGVGLRAPVVHGTHHLIPENWEGKQEALTRHDPPDRSPDDEESVATTLEAARALEFPYWREPNPLPEGWKLRRAWYGGFEAPLWGFCSAYYTEPPGKSLKACGAFNTVRRFSEESSYLVETGLVVRETRVIAGRPAMILWSPPGPQYVWYLDIHILVDDPETESAYEFIYSGPRRSDSDGNARLAEALDLVTSFFEREQARPFIRPRPDNKPHIGATVVTTVFSVETTSPRYDRYDTTGEVATAGSYAFLADPADTTSAVTTYEALRDGTTTALLIHKSDAHGASQAALYDTVEAGDLFEWHEADDCFVRYTVTEVKPDPAGAVPRKLLAVEWMTYAFTGCSGAISADAEVGMTSGNMLDLGGVGLRAPVVHGTHHLVPSTWEGETEATTRHEPDTPPKQEETGASTLAEVRALHLPYWREPTLPEGWILDRAWEGGLHAPWKGFCSVYLTEPLQFPDGKERQKGIEVCGTYNTVRKFAQKASFYADQGASPDGLIVRETRVIAGRPAVILWSPPGPNYLWNADVRIYIDDPKTETSYSITVAAPHRSDLAADGNAKLEKAIALATSLFESPLPSATAFRYDTYDLTGEVAEPGSYAFLADPADTTSAVTTYEALRDGTTTALLIHKSDAHGASQAALYDTVEAGDLFEWHEADDCFVRYKVTEVKPDPGAAVPRKLLAVEWMTYAFTGCRAGAVSASAAATVDWGELPDLGGASLRVPIVHGTAQLVPPDWTGPMKRAEFHDHFITESAEAYTTDPAEARDLDYWREPELPPGWRLARAFSGGVEGPPLGYCAHYLNAEGRTGVYICGYQDGLRYEPREAHIPTGLVSEARIVAGRPAVVRYNPNPVGRSSITVWVYDAATEGVYRVDGRAPSHVSGNVEAVITIARSLFEPPNPLPPPTAFRYDTYDTTGEVAEPGSYAFLADPADTTSAVTTYEALRDGTTTALLIHKSDARGASQAALYDAVEAGDLFEWREADDCFVRYRVTDVPAVGATAAYREFGVRPETYAFQSCQTGSLPAGASAVHFAAAADLPLEHLGGTNLTDFAVVHGVRQLVPDGVLLPSGEVAPGATIAVEPTRWRELTPLALSVPDVHTSDLEEARPLPYWREPRLPGGWRLAGVRSGDYAGVLDGYWATYAGPDGYPAVRITGAYASGLSLAADASWTTNVGKLIVRELRMIAGRPATVKYSPLGPKHNAVTAIEVEVYDAATGAGYILDGLSGGLRGGPAAAERVIAIACSLFWSESECAAP